MEAITTTEDVYELLQHHVDQLTALDDELETNGFPIDGTHPCENPKVAHRLARLNYRIEGSYAKFKRSLEAFMDGEVDASRNALSGEFGGCENGEWEVQDEDSSDEDDHDDIEDTGKMHVRFAPCPVFGPMPGESTEVEVVEWAAIVVDYRRLRMCVSVVSELDRGSDEMQLFCQFMGMEPRTLANPKSQFLEIETALTGRPELLRMWWEWRSACIDAEMNDPAEYPPGGFDFEGESLEDAIMDIINREED